LVKKKSIYSNLQSQERWALNILTLLSEAKSESKQQIVKLTNLFLISMIIFERKPFPTGCNTTGVNFKRIKQTLAQLLKKPGQQIIGRFYEERSSRDLKKKLKENIRNYGQLRFD
jgi:hypothetical protein